MVESLESWKEIAAEYGLKDILKPVKKKLSEVSLKKKVIYPRSKDIFRAFELTSFKKVKIVILGQDPYHGPNQANGLAFSVNSEVRFPPSLLNIFKEYSTDLNLTIPTDGNLSVWGERGVLLLNSILTVESGLPGSHKDFGWEEFTNQIIKALSDKKSNLVFILWGAHAQSKKILIDSSKHLIIASPHPSPLSAHRGFFGSKPFSKTNDYLRKNKNEEIDWKI
jgi:uracil-DNA glycosylase